MVIVPSPRSIWDYPYLDQVSSLVHGTRPKPEQDPFPPKIRIPETHVTCSHSFHRSDVSERSPVGLRSIVFSLVSSLANPCHFHFRKNFLRNLENVSRDLLSRFFLFSFPSTSFSSRDMCMYRSCLVVKLEKLEETRNTCR